jgi:predicted nucleotide-binding protein
MEQSLERAFRMGTLMYANHLHSRGLIEIPESWRSELAGLCHVFGIPMDKDASNTVAVDTTHRIRASVSKEAASAFQLGFLLSSVEPGGIDSRTLNVIDHAWEGASLPLTMKPDLSTALTAGDLSGLITRISEYLAQPLRARSKKVFVVHGHDEGIKESVARFLASLDLQPIILHEQPNQGRTVSEKLYDHADVAFAVVLMTADDIGGVKGKPTKDLSLRARQNVILELGYFWAMLGKRFVCALRESGVEIPSDYQGLLYITIDSSGAWKMQLAKELRAAGLSVDLNKVL